MSAGHLALAPEIAQFRADFERISTEADALSGPLRDDQFNWRRTADTWSVGQCLEHLNAVARFYLPLIDEAIARAVRRGTYGTGPFRYGRIWSWLVSLTAPPPRVRVNASGAFQPGSGRARRDIMTAFHAYQAQYIDRLHQANGLDLARSRIRPPFVPWPPMPLGLSFAAIIAHERRHLWQMRRVVEGDGFPK